MPRMLAALPLWMARYRMGQFCTIPFIMLSKFAKNSILVGQVEAYCLVCECHLSTEESASEHLRNPAHATNLHAVGYYDKYQHDYIRKVKNGYFCGMCNTLLATATRVGLHVAETSHANNRGALLLSRAGGTSGSTSGGSTGSGVLAYGTVLLQEDAWHGLVDDTCVICNAEFDEKNTHKNEPMHILKLVQSKVLFGAEKSVYRKIDEYSYQCLSCNNVFSTASFNEHFDSTDHRTAHKQCIVTDKNISKSVTNSMDTKGHEYNGDIKTSISKQNDVPIAKESIKVTEVKDDDHDDVIPKESNKVTEVKDDDLDYVILKESIKATEVTGDDLDDVIPKESIKVTEVKDDDLDDVIPKESIKATDVKGDDLDDVYCEVLGAKNYIIVLDGDMGLYCVLCHTNLQRLESISQHLNGKHHQNLFKLHRERIENKTESKKDTEEANKNNKVNDNVTKTKKDTENATKTKKNTEKATKPKKDTKEGTKTKKDIKETNKTVKDSDYEIVSNNIDNRSQILDSASKFQKNEVNINLINDTAFCKKCTMNIDFDFNAINKHIDNHKMSNKKEDRKVAFDNGVKANGGNINLFTKPVFKTQNEESNSATSLEDIRAVAKKNGMMYNGRELHCTICDLIVPVKVKDIEEHISGSSHKAKMCQSVVKQAPKKMKITKELSDKFIKDLTTVEREDCKDIVINEKFCISQFNFLFMGKTLTEVACIACNMKLSSPEVLVHHIDSQRHRKIMKECHVITSLDSEFVREIKPHLYQCGFCNQVSSSWENLEEHLETSDHKRSKMQAEWRLQEHMAEIRAHKVRKEMELEMFMRMCMASMQSMFMPNMFNNSNFDFESD